jgi:hypothetical protein
MRTGSSAGIQEPPGFRIESRMTMLRYSIAGVIGRRTNYYTGDTMGLSKVPNLPTGIFLGELVAGHF